MGFSVLLYIPTLYFDRIEATPTLDCVKANFIPRQILQHKYEDLDNLAKLLKFQFHLINTLVLHLQNNNKNNNVK